MNSHSLLPFTAHKVEFAPGQFTIDDGGDDVLHSLLTRVVVERAGGTLRGKRLLDLGCMEGGYAAVFARLGASEAVGLEVREQNFARCRFLKEQLGFSNVTYVQGDAKDIAASELGSFDIVFASGILYHLDNPHDFLTRCFAITTGFLLLDTHIAAIDSWAHGCSERLEARTWGGKTYIGREAEEYSADASADDLEGFLWASYGNPSSFWLTQDSLLQMLNDIGFSHVSKIFIERGYKCKAGCTWECRVVYVCKKGLPEVTPVPLGGP